VNILYDGKIYEMQVAGGINRYFENVITRLPNDVWPTLNTIYRRNKLHYPTHNNLNLQEFPHFRPYRLLRNLRSCYFRIRHQHQSFDILHPTYYSLLSKESLVRSEIPLVITVYDMIHEIFSDKIEPSGLTVHNKEVAIKAADAIICISESTKKDVLRYYPDVEHKIFITHLATSLNKSLSYGCESVPSKPYFLYVGSRSSSYKKFDTLLFAFALTASASPDVVLCVVGSIFEKREQELIHQLNLSARIHHYQTATDRHLAKLYRCSVALVYPSSYEGFGIPLLEAMACGTPVIASDTSSIPEVVGKAGILIDAGSTNDLTDAMATLISSPSKRDCLIGEGYQRIKRFSWDNTAAETLKIYNSLL